jgi:4-amino-4-deoxy-L-arabinose transferase-like glycosyltransferase
LAGQPIRPDDHAAGTFVRQGDIGGRRLSLAFAFILLLFAIGAIIFAQAQNVWIDETTQLSGMTLTPGPLIEWLSGKLDIPFGVPADRMPPVSYFIDMLAWRLSGGDVLAIRLFHAAITASGILVLMLATARRFSGTAALITGLILVLSPKLTDVAVEIRAYPMFFAISCAQVALLLDGGVAARPRRLIAFLLLGLLSGYTHFFGVIATSAFFLALFIDAPTVRTAIRAVLGYVVLLLLWLGLAPFIMGAASITATELPPPMPGFHEIVTFGFRVLGSSPLLINPVIAILYFIGAGLLSLLGALGLLALLARKGIAVRHEPAVGLTLALVSGLVVVVGGAFVLSGFNTLAPKYNIWMLPPLAVLIALVADGILAPHGKFARIARMGALAMFAAGAIWGHVHFLSRANLFIHGPSQTLEAMLDRAGPNTAIVHVGRGWAWGYFPLYWRHHDALAQWVLSADGHSVSRIRNNRSSDAPQPLSALAPYRALIVSNIELKGYEDLQRVDAADAIASTAQPITYDLVPAIAEAGWQGVETVSKPGYYALTGQIYRNGATP